MTSVEFERMLSTKPGGPHADAVCIRDLIFDHYLLKYQNEETADRCTRAFTDLLAAEMRIK